MNAGSSCTPKSKLWEKKVSHRGTETPRRNLPLWFCDSVAINMSSKLNVTVLLGGPSAEREVSLRSGAGVAKALRSLGHAVNEVDPKEGRFALPPATDVVFLALHGTYGEDGTVQRQLETLGVPYTGCDADASRIAFDKVLTKERCVAAGVPTPKFLVVDSEKISWPAGWE